MIIDQFELTAGLGLLIPTVILFGCLVKPLLDKLWKSVLMLLRKTRMEVTLYAFRASYILEGLTVARKFDIRRSMHKDMLYGALLELAKNQRVWHESSVSPEYSHLTDDGKVAIIHVVEELFRGLQTIHKQEVKEEAKRQTLESLK